MKCKREKSSRKSESVLSFSYENTITRAGFAYRLCRLKPRTSRSKTGFQQTAARIESMTGM